MKIFRMTVKGFHINLNEKKQFDYVEKGRNKKEVLEKPHKFKRLFKKGTYKLVSVKLIGIDYSAKLPRKIKTDNKCQFILDQGQRCENKATHETSAFLDGEIYSNGWITLTVCNEHFLKIK